MSNIMSMVSVRNKPHRDGFDLSRKNAFTAKLGELLPVLTEDVMPGDHFEISADWFTRTQPVTSPAYCRFSEYYDFFFVPYHLLWRYFPQFIIQTNDNNWATSSITAQKVPTQHPYISYKELIENVKHTYTVLTDGSIQSNDFDAAGLNPTYGLFKLLSYLGYGIYPHYSMADSGGIMRPYTVTTDYADIALNPFPAAAYQKIYQDFFRNSQWETPAPWSYNFDYLDGRNGMKIFVEDDVDWHTNGLFTIRYANYNKDYFLGRLPSKQYGDPAIAAPLVNPDGSLPNFVSRGYYASKNAGGSTTEYFTSLIGRRDSQPGQTSNVSDIFNSLGLSALAIRHAEYLQKWKEITQSGGTDYVSQIEKHFGVKPNSEMAHRVKYLGGFDKKFGIDEVVNTNLNSANSEATLFGKGINGGHGSIKYDVREHGIIMCIYHISLLPEYNANCTDKLCLKTMPSDYVIPELDNVGMQSVNYREFVGYLFPMKADSNLDRVVGYVPRYAEYKTHIDKVHGAFAEDLTNWVTPLNRVINYNNPAYNYDDKFFYKVRPKTLNGVFSVNVDSTVSTDQFLVNCNFDVKAVRNISRDGLPY